MEATLDRYTCTCTCNKVIMIWKLHSIGTCTYTCIMVIKVCKLPSVGVYGHV